MAEEIKEEITVAAEISISEARADVQKSKASAYRNYVFLPVIFLTVALVGGLRIGLESGEFIFVAPPLVCLVFAVALIVLFIRAKLLVIDGWFSDRQPALQNASAGVLLFSLFAASTQVFNSLIPEAGIPFWIVSFCFLWTLWNNLFARFDAKRLLQSLGGLFVLAFAVKYMILLNLSGEQSKSWWDFLSSGNITRETLSYLLAVKPYSGATGYLQFFGLAGFLIGLYFLPRRLRQNGG